MIRTLVQDVSGRFEERLHYSDNYRVQHVESIVWIGTADQQRCEERWYYVSWLQLTMGNWNHGK